ncbi:MAG: hypothetical protein Q9218_008320, partial [Villophora microphyllina]
REDIVNVCNVASKLLALLGEKGTTDEQIEVSVIQDLFLLNVSHARSEASVQRQLNSTIEAFPYLIDGQHFGALNAAPNWNDMESLRACGEVTDEIIRGVLGVELGLTAQPPVVWVIDPVMLGATFQGGADRHLRWPASAMELLVPMHHAVTSLEHWTLVHLNLLTGDVTHYDSLVGSSTDLDRFRRVENEIIPALCSAADTVMPSNFRYVQGDCAVQGANECGINVIANAVAIMRQEKVPTTVNALAKRLEYAQMITQARWSSICSVSESNVHLLRLWIWTVT